MVRGVVLAAPELGGLLLVALAVAGMWWWVTRADRGWPRRTLLGGTPSRKPVPVGPALTVAAGVVLIVAALAAAWPGDAGPGTYALITVLVLAWLGAAAVCALLSGRRARTARHRALHAASTSLHRRGRATDYLEAYR